MNLSGKRVLVTGAGGFIGSHLTELLVHEGAEVRAFCKYNGRGDLGKISQLPETVFRQLEIQSGDLQDPSSLIARWRTVISSSTWLL